MDHATCANCYPRGTIKIGDKYKSLCGKEVTLDYAPDNEHCPDCESLFGNFLKGERCPLCGKTGADHDRARLN